MSGIPLLILLMITARHPPFTGVCARSPWLEDVADGMAAVGEGSRQRRLQSGPSQTAAGALCGVAG